MGEFVIEKDQIKLSLVISMPDSLYDARLQGIMVDVFIKPCTRLSNDEYNYRDSLQARAIEGIGHCLFVCLFNIIMTHVSRDEILVLRENGNLLLSGTVLSGEIQSWLV